MGGEEVGWVERMCVVMERRAETERALEIGRVGKRAVEVPRCGSRVKVGLRVRGFKVLMQHLPRLPDCVAIIIS